MTKNKIFIIEDERHLREMLKDKLEAEKFSVDSVNTGKEALEYLKENKPDLVLLDLLLPDVNGFEVLTRIRSDVETKDIPVIIITNFDQREDIDRCKEMGISGFLVKSNFNLREIVEYIKKVVEK